MTTKLSPRAGTIFWGAILLLIASLVGTTTLLGSWSWSALVWLVVVFGALMVVAGLIGGISRAVSRPAEPAAPAASEAPTTSTASTDRLTPDSPDAPLP